MPREIVKFCRYKSYKKCKRFIEKYNGEVYNHDFAGIYAESLNKAWKKIEREYFKRLTKITRKQIKIAKIKGYLTLASRCPYDPRNNTFFVPFFWDIPHCLEVAGHETMHLHFHKYYFNEIEKELGNKETHDLKEALTILLDIEFQDLWHVSDGGYDSHKKLREFIKKEWLKNKDFDLLLNRCVNYLK
jgi:hypothetical protein